jgi:hypothetical protein
MKTLIAAATAAALLAASGFAAQAQTPGLDMQQKGSVTGSPGASGYAPGQQMRTKGSVKGTTGASGYAPGRTTTGASVKDDVDVKAGKSGARVGVKAGAKAKMNKK